MEFDAFESAQLKRLQLFLYLVPVFGFFPACWTLYRRNGNRQQRTVSRQVITLALAWGLSYGLLGAGSEAMIAETESLGVSLLLLNGLLTSSYFLVNLWLMVRLWQHKSLQLPGISQVSKHLP